MARGDQMIRQWSILMRLRQRRYSRRELANVFEVSRKTITRDIEALSGFPITEERDGIDVLYAVMPDVELPTRQLGDDDWQALIAAQPSLMAAVASTPLEDSFRRAFDKVLDLAAARSQARPVYRGTPGMPASSPALVAREAQLMDAALARRCVQLCYFTASRQARSVRVVEPYFVHRTFMGRTLIAYCHQREAFLDFGVGQIEALDLLDETFDPTARQFDLEAYLAEGFDGHRSLPVTEVRLHLRPPTATWARHQHFHPTQTIVRHPDGGVDVTFRTGGTEAVVARVLSYGPDCQVVAPDWLRDRVREVAAQIIANG